MALALRFLESRRDRHAGSGWVYAGELVHAMTEQSLAPFFGGVLLGIGAIHALWGILTQDDAKLRTGIISMGMGGLIEAILVLSFHVH